MEGSTESIFTAQFNSKSTKYYFNCPGKLLMVDEVGKSMGTVFSLSVLENAAPEPKTKQ